MRVVNLFGETLREAPAETEIVSHQLMLRAGFIRQLAAGIFSYLPLAQRSLRKIEQILREEMDAIGAQEIEMPVVHPAEIWQKTGRWQAIDETMVRFKDRKGHEMVLALTHEEVVAELTRSEIKSYKQLPQAVYQIQTKFRDEQRARGGLIRVREFIMKDSYTLDRDEAGLAIQYAAHYNAYHRIGARVGLNLIAVGSDVGMMGGKVAHEFMYLSPIGEDSLIVCENCDYAANQEIAEFEKPRYDNGPALEMEKVATPGAKTIEDLSQFLGIEPHQTCKAVFFVAEYGKTLKNKLVVALVRGDMDVNDVLVKNWSKANVLRAATPEEISAVGMVPGYASTVGITNDDVLVIADDLISLETNLVAGANEEGYHLRNVNCGRDFKPDIIVNIATARSGDTCVKCGGKLTLQRGVEVGNIFQLGTRYTEAMGANYVDEAGQLKAVVMGSYGIGVGRLLACIAEEYRDDRGLKLPISIAPYAVCLISLCRTPEGQERANTLYTELLGAGIETLYDDRKDVSAGVKFADSELRGIPLQIVISEKSMERGGVEWKLRGSDERTIVSLDETVSCMKQEIAKLHALLSERAENAPKWDKG